ncbi:UNVERIFIED_CONTAM: glycosyltransferase [Acinetobacter seifertii]
MKMLYIGPNVEKISTGGDSVNKRNEDLLKKIFNEDLDVYYIPDPNNTLFEKLRGYLGGITKCHVNKVIEKISKNNVDCVFLSQSFYGKLCKVIRKKYPLLKIITFYHNIETHYAKEYVRTSGMSHYPFYLLATYNEKQTIKYSDHHFVLNERDADLMCDIYGVKSDFSLPVSYKDVFDPTKVKTVTNAPLKILFVGTAFFGNIPGVEFFIKEVMPHINAELTIVGKGMDKFKERFETKENIKVFGFVEDLSALYYDASIVIAPIFSGGGMKTKVAEALMYGKTLIGTKEAFEGYVKVNSAMIECNTAAEFISCINQNRPYYPYNEVSRQQFLAYYDTDILHSSLNDFFHTNFN